MKTTTENSALQSVRALRATLDDHLQRLMQIECDDGDAADVISEAIDLAEKARAAAYGAICRLHGIKAGDRVKGCGPNVPKDTCGAPIGTVVEVCPQQGTAKVQWDGRDWLWHNVDDLKRL